MWISWSDGSALLSSTTSWHPVVRGGCHAISRQPVSETFIKLASESHLGIRPQRGTFVAKISLAHVMDARFVREAVEADIIKLLAAAPLRRRSRISGNSSFAKEVDTLTEGRVAVEIYPNAPLGKEFNLIKRHAAWHCRLDHHC